jgi:hypothetical protein
MLDSVQYVNFHYNEDLENKEKGLYWVIVALNDECSDLRLAITSIFEDNSMLKLYDDKSSYFWKNRGELIDVCDVLKGKNLFVQSQILTGYRKWKAEKIQREAERKDDIGKMLMTTSEMTDGATPRLITTDRSDFD